MVSTLSSITDLSTVSNTTTTIQQISDEVSRFIQGSMHSQEHVSTWIISIQATFPQSDASIALLLKIKKLVGPALVFTYSVGCFQDMGALVATGGSLAEHGSITYAQLKWRDSTACGLLRTLSRALQQVLLLSCWLSSIMTPLQTSRILMPSCQVSPIKAEPPADYSTRTASSWTTVQHCSLSPSAYKRKFTKPGPSP